jgi:predicted nucleotidyltransferase
MGEAARTSRMAARRSKPALKASLKAAVEAVAQALAQKPLTGMLIGGIAVIARGVPRTTRDVDATISASPGRVDDVLRIFEQHELVPRIDDARAFAQANQVLLLRHAPSGVDVDVSLAWLPFELEAITASERLQIGEVRVPVARPEDLVIYKAIAWRPQDQQDVERLLSLHGKRMDLVRVQRVVAELAAALDEPERATELERVIERTLK